MDFTPKQLETLKRLFQTAEANLKTEIGTVKTEIASVKTELGEKSTLRTDTLDGLDSIAKHMATQVEVDALTKRVEKLEKLQQVS